MNSVIITDFPPNLLPPREQMHSWTAVNMKSVIVWHFCRLLPVVVVFTLLINVRTLLCKYFS